MSGSWLITGCPHMGLPPEEASSKLMLRVDHDRWGQTMADLRHLALSAAHPRSRERFLAFHEITQGSCATVSRHFGDIAQQVISHQFPVLNWWALVNVLTRASALSQSSPSW